MNLALDGQDKCEGCIGKLPAVPKATRQYLLAKADDRARLDALSESPELKSLRDEIALVRMLVERRWNLIHTDNDLILAAPQLTNMMQTLERLVKTADVMDRNEGRLLARQAVIRIGQELVRIVMEELEEIPGYEEIVDRIGERFMATMGKAQNDAVARSVTYLEGDE
jgi:hypothetical protein